MKKTKMETRPKEKEKSSVNKSEASNKKNQSQKLKINQQKGKRDEPTKVVKTSKPSKQEVISNNRGQRVFPESSPNLPLKLEHNSAKSKGDSRPSSKKSLFQKTPGGPVCRGQLLPNVDSTAQKKNSNNEKATDEGKTGKKLQKRVIQ